MAKRNRQLQQYVLVFVCVLSVYQLTSRARLYGGDDLVYLNLARNFFTYGPKYGFYEEEMRMHKFALGQVLLDLPVGYNYGQARESHGRLPSAYGEYSWNIWWIGLLAACYGGLHALVFFGISRCIGLGYRGALLNTLIFAFCTMRWPAAQRLHADVSLDLFMLAACWGILDFARSGRWYGLLVAGICTGELVLLKSEGVLYAGCVTGLLGWYLWKDRRLRGALTTVDGNDCHQSVAIRGWWLALFVVPVLVGTAMFMGYNWWRFGQLFNSGYAGEIRDRGFSNSALGGIYGYLFSPGKSIFLYNPVLILALIGWRDFCRRAPALAVCGVVAMTANVLLHCAWWAWAGDWYWGPRFLIATLGVPMLAVIFGIRRLLAPTLPCWRRRAGGALVAALIVGSLLVQGLGVAVCNNEYIWQAARVAPVLQARESSVDSGVMMHFVPEFSAIPGHWWVLRVLLARDGDWQAIYERPPWYALNPRWVAPAPEHMPFSFNVWWLLPLQTAHPYPGWIVGGVCLLVTLAICSGLLLLRCWRRVEDETEHCIAAGETPPFGFPPQGG